MTSSRIEGPASRRLKICAPPDRARRDLRRPQGNRGRFVLGASERNCDVERNAFPRHLEYGAMVGRGGIHRGS
jgi:hypothetical protein